MMKSQAIFWERMMIKKVLFLTLSLIYAAFSCYLYEQIIFEVFIHHLQSFYRQYELIFIIVSFFLLCVMLPLAVLYLRPYYLKYVLMMNLGIPLIFISIISLSNLSLYLGKPLYVKSKLYNSDAIIIFGLSNFYLRSLYAAELYHKNYADRILVFASKGHKFRRYYEYLERDLGIPHEKIIGVHENASINTYIVALTVKKIMNQYGWKRAIIVSDPFHMYRLIKVIKKAEIQGIYPVCIPDELYRAFPTRLLGLEYQKRWETSLSDLDFSSRFEFRHRLLINVLHEYVGICFYWLKGYI